jgi:hypothetical protein
MECRRVPLDGGGAAIVCGRGGRARCSVCRRRPATRACDWKIGHDEGQRGRSGGYVTCDAPLCKRCSHVPAPDKDLCPKHAEAWAARLARDGAAKEISGALGGAADRLALTIWQPWASLIVAGLKPFEFRRRPAPRGLVGRRIVIHAGKRRPTPAELRAIRLWPHRTCGASVEREAAAAVLDGELPLASGVGEATLGRAVRVIEEPSLIALAHEFDEPVDGLDPDLWAWPMLEPAAWPKPAPARGAQGFWPWRPIERGHDLFGGLP